MAFEIYGPETLPKEFVPDNGKGNPLRGYPILPKDTMQDIIYDKRIQDINAIQANVVAIFTTWFKSFFEPDYFKNDIIKTQVPFTRFKSFMMDIYTKDKPILAIDPRTPEIDEQFLYAQTMLNRYNLMDPEHDNIGAKINYSHVIIGTDLLELRYRPNRMRFPFDVMIVEKGRNRMENTYNSMVANINHRSKFMLIKVAPLLIPNRYIINIATFHGYDWRSQDFLHFLNSYSKFPIKKEIRNNGRLCFYMLKEIHLQFETPDFPAKDGTEYSNAIEWGARIVDQFIITAELPMEYIFLTSREHAGKFDTGIELDENSITWISDVHAYLDWPTEYGDFKLISRIDMELQEGDEDCTFDAGPLIKDVDLGMYNTIQHWIEHSGDIRDLVQVHIWPDGSYDEVASRLHPNGVVELINPKLNQIYVASLYINVPTINLIREGETKRRIGTIEIDRSPE